MTSDCPVCNVVQFRPLSLFAVHSCKADIWIKHPRTHQLLELHKEFHNLGGKVIGILCGRGSQPDEKVRKAYANMRDVGVYVKYYNIDASLVDHTWTWDFLYIPETNQSVIWSAFAKELDTSIVEAAYINSTAYKTVDLVTLWHEISNHASLFPEDVPANRVLKAGSCDETA